MDMENLRIIDARPEHVGEILALLREFAEYENLSQYVEATEEKLRAALFGEDRAAEALVAADGERAVGYAVFYPNFATFRGQRGYYLEDIYISANYRKKGLGAMMLKEIARRGRRLVIDARGEDELEIARARLDALSEVVALPGDIATEAHRRALVAAADRGSWSMTSALSVWMLSATAVAALGAIVAGRARRAAAGAQQAPEIALR